MWKSPTPYEESLAKIDDYLRTHQFTEEQLHAIRIYHRGDKRSYGLRHLRLTAAVNRIRAMDGKPPIALLP